MSEQILILNSGSSSLKYSVFRMGSDRSLDLLTHGLIESIGGTGPSDHTEALTQVMTSLGVTFQLFAIGHRVVHGGERFSNAVIIDSEVVEAIRSLVPLAPLHNPANLEGIQACLRLWPKVHQVAVFDTAFHQTMPQSAYRYPLPESYFKDHGVRRYGFHGTSYRSIHRRMASYLQKAPETLNLIAFHLGNGASICRIQSGRSVDTSMGLTPMGGLIMGSRSGDLDPGLVLYLLRDLDLSVEAVDDLLNRESGIKGVAGSNDMRLILEGCRKEDPCSMLAFQIFIRSIRHFLGAYLLEMPELDAICFTGGIGENAPEVRSSVLKDLQWAGIRIDQGLNGRNNGCFGEIHHVSSRTRIVIVPTEEEREIAEQTLEVLALSREALGHG